MVLDYSFRCQFGCPIGGPIDLLLGCSAVSLDILSNCHLDVQSAIPWEKDSHLKWKLLCTCCHINLIWHISPLSHFSKPFLILNLKFISGIFSQSLLIKVWKSASHWVLRAPIYVYCANPYWGEMTDNPWKGHICLENCWVLTCQFWHLTSLILDFKVNCQIDPMNCIRNE